MTILKNNLHFSRFGYNLIEDHITLLPLVNIFRDLVLKAWKC